jgi:aminomethyltransferase
MSTARRTPLYQKHVAAGARMVEFAGWEMPVQYAGVIEEHRAVREKCGVFDVSHMGEVEFTGPRGLEALNRIVSNDLTKCADGQAQYSVLCNAQGGIVDDVVVYRFSSERLLVCVNAANREKDGAHFEKYGAPLGASVAQKHDDYAQLAVQGPGARALLQPLTSAPLAPVKNYHFTTGEVAGVPCIIARTGYTGEDGFELFCPPDAAPRLWDAVVAAGAQPCGLGARDSLRLESAYRLYGNDMDDATSPFEAGLAWTVKLDKGDFVGREALLAQKAAGLKRKIAGFELVDRGVPRHGYRCLRDGAEVGAVTSGTMSPTLKKPIGLAYLPPELAAENAVFDVEIRGRGAAARVVKTPFYKRQS